MLPGVESARLAGAPPGSGPGAAELGQDAGDGVRAPARRVPYGSRLVEQRRPAAELPGQPVDHRPRPLGAERRAGETALRGEGPGDLLVLLGGQQVADRLADRDERGLARHLQEREPGPGGGVQQLAGDGLVAQPDAEPQPGDPPGDQALDVRRGVRPGQAHPRGENELAPSRNGVGSSSSLTATQRTGRSSASCPARTASPNGSRRTTVRSVGATTTPGLYVTARALPAILP
nr:hypothetical protein GCM10020093_101130 [Planobispora longispora]